MKKSLKIIASIGFGIFFLWMAFRKVELTELYEAASQATFWWLLAFIPITLFAHYLRAERWRLLIKAEDRPMRITLFSGVMLGYLINIALPRVGEVTRPVYVAQKAGLKSSKLIGNIVLERIIDVLSMGILMLLVIIFVVTDTQSLSRIFGTDITSSQVYENLAVKIFTAGIILICLMVLIFFVLKRLSDRSEKISALFHKIRDVLHLFYEGILSIKDIDNWPLFILQTALIWVSYILMTYLPFWMFNLPLNVGLGLEEALVITVISAVGITIPTPGGIGTYHWFVTQGLFVLYALPVATGLAYATIAHASTMGLIIIFTPLALFFDKLLLAKKK